MVRRVFPFGAVTLALARLIASRTPLNGVRMHGEWQQRRYVMARFSHPPARVDQAQSNLDAGELDLPAGLDPECVIAETRSFGMRVEALRRRMKFFEFEVDSDGETHIVHAFHHVATCGYRGPWPQVPTTTGSATCQYCLLEASIRPVFRARYHPAFET